MKTTRSSGAGFTLIEVLIVVAIMGILSAIAYPSYSGYVTKSRRSDGHLGLLNAVQAIERCKATTFTYAGCTLPTTASPEGYYALSVTTTASSYTITATAQNKQTNDSLCPTLTLNDLGVQGHTGTGPCWD